MSDVLSYGMNALQQGAEDYAKAQKQNEEAKNTAIGNRGLYDIAVKSGALTLDQQIEFNKGNPKKQNDILAGAMRTWNAQREIEQDKQRQQAFQLQLNQEERAKAQEARAKAIFDYRPGADVYSAANASNLNVIPGPPGQPPTFHPYAQAPPTQEEMQAVNARSQKFGGEFIPKPGGGTEWRSYPTEQAKPPPTIRTPQGDVPLTSEIGQQRYQEVNPDIVVHQKFGARPSDFMPENVQVGGTDAFGKFDPKSDAKSHVQLKSTGAFMTTGDYTRYLRQLADAGKIDQPVQHPITQEWINPGKPEPEMGRPGPLDYTNPTHVALVQDAIKRNAGDVPAAMNELRQKGWY